MTAIQYIFIIVAGAVLFATVVLLVISFVTNISRYIDRRHSRHYNKPFTIKSNRHKSKEN